MQIGALNISAGSGGGAGKVLLVVGGGLAAYLAYCWWRDRATPAVKTSPGADMTPAGAADTTFGRARTRGLVATAGTELAVRKPAAVPFAAQVAKAVATVNATEPATPAPNARFSTNVQSLGGIVVHGSAAAGLAGFSRNLTNPVQPAKVN